MPSTSVTFMPHGLVIQILPERGSLQGKTSNQSFGTATTRESQCAFGRPSGTLFICLGLFDRQYL